MTTPYRKLYLRLWTDEKFAAFSPAEKLVAVYVMTAQSNRLGLFRFSPALAAEQTGLPLGEPPPNVGGNVTPNVRGDAPRGCDQTYWEAFAAVCAALGWRWDGRAKVLYIPSWWKHQRPDNPNVLKGALDDLGVLPQTPLLAEFLANTAHLPPDHAKVLAERSGNVTPDVTGTSPPTTGEPGGIKEKEKEKEKEKDNPPPTPPRFGEGGTSDDRPVPPRKSRKARRPDPEAHPLFPAFWAAYPKKAAKPDAARAFAKFDPDDALLARMLAAIDRQARSDDWRKDQGKFIPHPATWLNHRRWEDEPLATPAGPADSRPVGRPPTPAELAAMGLI